MKCIMFLLIMICVFVEFLGFIFYFNVLIFVLLIVCFGNVVYYILCCFVLELKNNKFYNCLLIFFLIESIIGILLVLL